MKCISMACIAIALVGADCCRAQQAGGSGGAKAAALQATESRETAAQAAVAIQQALTLERQANFPEAQAKWASVIKLEPRNGQAYAHLGLLEARLGHYPEAIAHYRKAKALDAAIPELNLNLGLALFKANQYRDAAQVFEAELRAHPNAADKQKLTTLAAMSYYGAHQYGAAIPYLKEASAADPRNLTLLLTLAHCYLWTKQLDATMTVYKQILTIDPDSAAADMIAGEALDEKGDNAGAVQQFRAAVAANPKEENVHFALAYLLWSQKRYSEAIPEFKAELENDQKNYQAMIYLGNTYVQLNQFDDARKLLETAVQYMPDVPLIHLDLGIIYMETGDHDAAIREFTKTVALQPDNVTAHFRLGTLYRSIGKRDEAKAEFAKASALNKKTDESQYKRIADANARPEPDAKAAPKSDDPAAAPKTDDPAAKPAPQ